MSGKALTFTPATRLQTLLSPTVWHRITPLAIQHKAVNLGQGFPGFSPPMFVRETLSNVTLEKDGLTYMANQYARSAADLSFAQVLATKFSKQFDRKINPLTEVIACNGATGVIFNATHAFLNPGDECVVFEPAFDIYTAQVNMCGAKVTPVTLTMKSTTTTNADGTSTTKNAWDFDMKAFEAAFNEKTRMFIFNSPHNPTGKVFTKSELEQIAAVLRKYPDVVVIADEVYEYLVFNGHEHISLATLPDMYERTLTVGSSGKTLSCTGWKIGWAVGPEHLVQAMGVVGSWVTFSVNTPCQIAIGRALEKAHQTYQHTEDGEVFDSYYAYLLNEYTRKRDKLAATLDKIGLQYAMPEGSFFIVADISKVNVPAKYVEQYKKEGLDWAFAGWVIEEIGVATIPCSAFYCDENKDMVRFIHLLRLLVIMLRIHLITILFSPRYRVTNMSAWHLLNKITFLKAHSRSSKRLRNIFKNKRYMTRKLPNCDVKYCCTIMSMRL